MKQIINSIVQLTRNILRRIFTSSSKKENFAFLRRISSKTKTRIKGTMFYKNIRYSIVKNKRIYGIVWQIKASYKFQKDLVLKNFNKIIIVLLCLTLLTFLALITGTVPIVIKNIKKSATEYLTPYNSYSTLSYAPMPDQQGNIPDQYLEEDPSTYHSIWKTNSMNSDKPGEIANSLVSPGRSPSLATYNYNKIKDNTLYGDLSPLIGDSAKNIFPSLNIYQETGNIKKDFKLAIDNCKIIQNFYKSLIKYFILNSYTSIENSPGLGGLTFFENQMSEFKYLDSYIYYLYCQYGQRTEKFYTDYKPDNISSQVAQSDVLRCWAISKTIAAVISIIIINAHNQSTTKIYFSKFETQYIDSNTGINIKGLLMSFYSILLSNNPNEIEKAASTKEDIKEPNSHNTDINGFSELLIGLISYFAPYFVKVKFAAGFDKILQYYNNVIDNKQNVHNFLNKNINTKVVRYASNSKLNFLTFGNLPYDPKKDELYTSLNGNFLLNKNVNISNPLWGLKKNSRFWNKNKSAFNSLINNNAYTNINDDMLLDGKTPNKAIPIVLNQTTISKYSNLNFTNIGKIIKYSILRKTRSSNNKFVTKQYHENIYLKVVGHTNSYGPSIFYTSRQEANAIVFDRNSGIPDVHQEYNWQINTKDPNERNTDNDHTENLKCNETYYTPPIKKPYFTKEKLPPTFGDGLGYFNGSLQSSKSNVELNGMLITSTSTFNFTKGLLFGSGIKNLISGNYITSGVNNYTYLISIITYLVLTILIIIGLIIFLVSGKIIISTNKRIFATLKVLGYTTNRIIGQSLSIYFIFGIISSVAILPLFSVITNLYTRSIQNYFGGQNVVIPPVEINLLFILIYFGILLSLYLLFWIFSVIQINKTNVIEILGDS